MVRYLFGRLGQAVLVLWATFTLSFLLLQVLPGDAILIKFEGGDLGLSPEQIAELRVAYGADAPVWAQYWATLRGFLGGDFGLSISRGVPVTQLFATNLPATLRLTLFGSLAAVALALALAVAATLPRLRWLREIITGLPALMISLPVFWIGILLIQIFSFRLKLIPVIGAGPWEGLILPVIALAVPIAAPIAQILIRAIDEVSLQPFVAVVRAKGAGPGFVLVHHVLRNATLPALTIAGVLFGELVAGAVVTETVFGLNGLGRLTEQAVNNQDAAVLQAILVISALGFVLVNLAVDLVYPLIDPRLKSSMRAAR